MAASMAAASGATAIGATGASMAGVAASSTNVAGAIEWFDDLSSNPDRTTYTRALTDGTPGVLDHEDAYTVQVFMPALLFEKTAVNVTSGEDPATVATAGDTLRYRLRIENLSDTPLSGPRIVDELDHLNASAMFQAGTLNVITVPAGQAFVPAGPPCRVGSAA